MNLISFSLFCQKARIEYELTDAVMPAADVLRDMTVQCLRDSNEHTLSGMYDTVEGTVIIKPP